MESSSDGDWITEPMMCALSINRFTLQRWSDWSHWLLSLVSRLVEETGHRLVIGDALRIRQFAAHWQEERTA